MSEVLAGEIVESRTPEQWAAVVRSDLGQAVAGFIAAGRHLSDARPQIPHGTWDSWLRRDVGITQPTAYKLMLVAQNPALVNHSHGNDLPPSWTTLYELSQLEAPLLEAAILAGRVTPELERKQARALVIEYKTKAAEVTYDPRHGDFTTRLEDLEPGSVDAVITDPPYPAEHLPLYGKLSEHAARWLKPGGICAVMSGQIHLPDVIRELATQLTYHWTMAYLTPGGQAVQVFPRRVNTFWKPVLVFRNGEGPAAEWFGDVAKSDTNDNDKRFHHWGQSESGMADLVKRLTRPGEMVCDPFMGAGTTGVAALALGRSFVGCDVNADHVSDARERLEQTVLERLG
jgi:site-specific DNA-methyltransferase (adenine-specific)